MLVTRLLVQAALAIFFVASDAGAGDRDECVAAASSAQDLRRDNKLVSAREQLITCARAACPAAVQHDCVGWLAEIEDAMPTITLTVSDANGVDVIEANILLDDRPYLTRLEGRALAMDPGIHVLHIEVAGATPFEQRIVVREGEKNRVVALTVPTPEPAPVVTQTPIEEPKPRPLPEPAPPPAAKPPRVDLVSPSQVPPVPLKATSSVRRRVALGIAGVGVVGIGVGAVFGLRASSKWRDARDACGSGCALGSDAYQLRDDARRYGTISTVSVITGGVALAGGAILYLVARPSRTTTVADMVLQAASTGSFTYAGRF